jgi:hypothetical protein
MSSAVEYEELESPEGKRWNEHSNVTYDEGYIKLGSVKGVFARSYLKYYERIKNFCILDDDLWVVSFPKTGNSYICLEEFRFPIQYNLGSSLLFQFV